MGMIGRYKTVRSDQEVDDLLNRCVEAADRGVSRFRGATYEDGIKAGIEWLLGDRDEDPFE